MEEKKRHTGIDVVGAVPWGTHFCLFYEDKQDLLDILVPYFKAGLENNEFCVWVISESLNEKKVKEVMSKAVPDFDQYLKRGQIEIVPYAEWFLKNGVFNGQKVLNDWEKIICQSQVKGYDGLRVTGGMTWLEKENWGNFTDYEEVVNTKIGDYRVLALCTYSLDKCEASEVIDVMRNHQFALVKRAGKWVLDKDSDQKRAQEGFENIVNLSPDMMGVFNTEGELIKVNPAWEIILGYKTEELLEMDWHTLVHPDDVEKTNKEVEKQLKGGPVVNFINRYKCKDGSYKILKWQATFANGGIVYATARDITGGRWGKENQETTVAETSERRLTLLQERFIKFGFEELGEQEIIELFLSLALSYPECQELAKKCLAEFKDLSGFLAASPRELEQIGIVPHCMFYIKLLHELPTEILRKKIIEQPFYQSSQEIFDYLYYSMRDLKKEVFKAIYLNARNQIIDTEDLFEGTLESIPIRPREIVDSAIRHGSAGIIFVHNHPSGDPTPSKGDKQLTRDLVFIGNIIEVKVLDHIIIGGNRYFSFADEGLITKYEDSFLNLRIRGVFDNGAGYR